MLAELLTYSLEAAVEGSHVPQTEPLKQQRIGVCSLYGRKKGNGLWVSIYDANYLLKKPSLSNIYKFLAIMESKVSIC